MALFLYLDASDKISTVALVDIQSGVIAARQNYEQKSHASIFHVHIDEVITESGKVWGQIQGIFVMNGPGSYTGLRLALAAAKGIAFIHQLPLYTANKLACLYHLISIPQPTAIILPARTNEYFCMAFDADGRQIMVNPCLSTSELLAVCAKNQLSVFSIFAIPTLPIAVHEINFSLVDIPRVVQQHIQQHKPADLFLAEPFYMKNVYINK